MIWVFAFAALAVAGLVAFAWVGVQAAREYEPTVAHGETRFTGGDGQWCPTGTPPKPLPRLERDEKREITKLWLADGSVLLNENAVLWRYGWIHFHEDKWFVPETGEFVPEAVVVEAFAAIRERERREAVKERARKYGGAA